jgi:antitoxin MazE
MMVKAARPSPAKPPSLEEMLAEIDRLGPACVPETVDWGPDRGAEIIDDAYSREEVAMPPDDHGTTSGASTRPRKKSST